VAPIGRTTEVPSIEPAKDGYVGITMVTRSVVTKPF